MLQTSRNCCVRSEQAGQQDNVAARKNRHTRPRCCQCWKGRLQTVSFSRGNNAAVVHVVLRERVVFSSKVIIIVEELNIKLVFSNYHG